MYHNILVPVAFDHSRDTARALQVAMALKAQNGRVTALHVVEQLPSYATEYLSPEILGAAREDLAATLRDKIGDLAGVDSHIVEGHAGRTILEQAQLNSVDLIVIASHCPSVQDYFLGSTAARVVRHASCAVHVVR